jgi:hypothetical protein
MKWAVVWLCPALRGLSGCFEPLVGTECAENQSLCGSRCVRAGTCALDAGLDTGGLDALSGTTEAGGPISAIDALPVDLSLGLDEGDDGGATGIDGLDGGTLPLLDGSTKDTPADKADRPPTDTRDVAQVDTRGADAPDVPSIIKDTRDAQSQDSRDASTPDTKDAPVVLNDDARDAPDASDVANATEVADAPAVQPEVGSDGGDVASTSLDATPDTPDASDLPDAYDDARDLATDRLDVSGPESRPDAQPPCPGQQVRCGGVCVDLQTSPTNCGLCGYACSQVPCIAGECTACPAGQTLCNEQCVDTSTDPAHCGGCGQVCASRACRFGDCKATTAGHIVVIGHDFQTNNVAMSRILGNAIFFSSEGDVTVVEYVGVAGSTPVSNSHVAITQVSNTVDRKVTLISDVTFSASDLASQLKSAQVFLIQSQTVATNTILVELGQAWASVLGTFVHTGGTIVVLDSSYPVNKGTTQILTGASLMKVTPVSTVNNDTCSVATPTDPIAVSVPASYPCLQNSVVFSGDGTHVVEDLGRPVVLHVSF